MTTARDLFTSRQQDTSAATQHEQESLPTMSMPFDPHEFRDSVTFDSAVNTLVKTAQASRDHLRLN